MKAPGGIVLLSVPFTAGVAVAAALRLGPAAGALCLAGAAGCFVAIARLKGRSILAAALLFVFLGALSWSAAGPPSGGHSTHGYTERSLREFSAIISRVPFPHPATRALLRALFTGQRDLLDRSTVRSFRAAGASHILALSGLHLGIIYLILSKILSFLGNSRTAWIVRSALTVLCCGFYTLMTGAGPSIVRAFLFIAISEIARNCPGRRKPPLNVWCTALLLQLAAKPSVITSPGFQMSYMAMLGIFVLLPILKGWYPSAGAAADRWDPFHRIWDAMALAISCQAFTAPLAWIHFHSFPKYFLLSNIVSLPLTTALMFSGTACIAAESMGIRPHILICLTDWLAETLRQSLAIIAGM